MFDSEYQKACRQYILNHFPLLERSGDYFVSLEGFPRIASPLRAGQRRRLYGACLDDFIKRKQTSGKSLSYETTADGKHLRLSQDLFRSLKSRQLRYKGQYAPPGKRTAGDGRHFSKIVVEAAGQHSFYVAVVPDEVEANQQAAKLNQCIYQCQGMFAKTNFRLAEGTRLFYAKDNSEEAGPGLCISHQLAAFDAWRLEQFIQPGESNKSRKKPFDPFAQLVNDLAVYWLQESKQLTLARLHRSVAGNQVRVAYDLRWLLTESSFLADINLRTGYPSRYRLDLDGASDEVLQGINALFLKSIGNEIRPTVEAGSLSLAPLAYQRWEKIRADLLNREAKQFVSRLPFTKIQCADRVGKFKDYWVHYPSKKGVAAVYRQVCDKCQRAQLSSPEKKYGGIFFSDAAYRQFCHKLGRDFELTGSQSARQLAHDESVEKLSVRIKFPVDVSDLLEQSLASDLGTQYPELAQPIKWAQAFIADLSRVRKANEVRYARDALRQNPTGTDLEAMTRLRKQRNTKDAEAIAQLLRRHFAPLLRVEKQFLALDAVLGILTAPPYNYSLDDLHKTLNVYLARFVGAQRLRIVENQVDLAPGSDSFAYTRSLVLDSSHHLGRLVVAIEHVHYFKDGTETKFLQATHLSQRERCVEVVELSKTEELSKWTALQRQLTQRLPLKILVALLETLLMETLHARAVKRQEQADGIEPMQTDSSLAERLQLKLHSAELADHLPMILLQTRVTGLRLFPGRSTVPLPEGGILQQQGLFLAPYPGQTVEEVIPAGTVLAILDGYVVTRKAIDENKLSQQHLIALARSAGLAADRYLYFPPNEAFTFANGGLINSHSGSQNVELGFRFGRGRSNCIVYRVIRTIRPIVVGPDRAIELLTRYDPDAARRYHGIDPTSEAYRCSYDPVRKLETFNEALDQLPGYLQQTVKRDRLLRAEQAALVSELEEGGAVASQSLSEHVAKPTMVDEPFSGDGESTFVAESNPPLRSSAAALSDGLAPDRVAPAGGAFVRQISTSAMHEEAPPPKRVKRAVEYVSQAKLKALFAWDVARREGNGTKRIAAAEAVATPAETTEPSTLYKPPASCGR